MTGKSEVGKSAACYNAAKEMSSAKIASQALRRARTSQFEEPSQQREAGFASTERGGTRGEPGEMVQRRRANKIGKTLLAFEVLGVLV